MARLREKYDYVIVDTAPVRELLIRSLTLFCRCHVICLQG